MKKHFPQGSVWRKWDLQVHVPGDHLNDGYRTTDGSNVLDKFCSVIEGSDVDVFGMTDYFSFESVKAFMDRFAELYPESKKTFFFNLELRINESVNAQLEEVNVHLLFNPASLDRVPKFLSSLAIVKTKADEVAIVCSDLTTTEEFASATVTREAIGKAFDATFGKKAVRNQHYLVFVAANNDGLRPARGAKRKEEISDEIDKFADGFFGGTQNTDYYLKKNRYEDDQISLPKPVIATSDSHSFEDLELSLGKQRFDEITKGAGSAAVLAKDVTWIKADPTYEGLKQVIYEPSPGHRVWIGPIKPDQKEPYMVIRRIRFSESPNFPSEIEFNDNLCSVIGSRSSGKSALLAYVADAVNPDYTRSLMREGPAAGVSWNDVADDYDIEWADGSSGSDVAGRVLLVRQNLLFEQSQDPEAIRERIEPIIRTEVPAFANVYNQAYQDIEAANEEIESAIYAWFDLAKQIEEDREANRLLGSADSVAAQLKSTQEAIDLIGAEAKLNETETNNYQEVLAKIKQLEDRSAGISGELELLSRVDRETPFFKNAVISLKPSLNSLPEALVRQIDEVSEVRGVELVKELNEMALKYKDDLLDEQRTLPGSIEGLRQANDVLLRRYDQQTTLKELAEKVENYRDTLKQIADNEASRKEKTAQQQVLMTELTDALKKRDQVLQQLPTALAGHDQSALEGIVFGIEFGIDEDDREHHLRGINAQAVSEFVKNYQVNLDEIRANPSKFLNALESGTQKVVKGFHKEDVAAEVLTLTETILLSGEMEGDRIGGFAPSTMTPGKRALFALRLILLESKDKWPLLLDQPEDDLDSRSIYEQIVPFLRQKKRERQIIMVSHNANLVVGSDSEQVIVANRNGSDRPNADNLEFNYLTGSLEFTKDLDNATKDTLTAQGVCEHACAILDGGRDAFEDRKRKYQIR